VTALASEAPKLDPSRRHLEKNSYIYASNGRVLAVLRGSENRRVVQSEQIADVMKQAIVAVEDRRFYQHRGIDIRGIVRALWDNLRNKKVVEGGSTITQQFVKNAYTKGQRSFGRKLKEAALAWQLEQQWSKDRILTAYLNTIYFGNGAYGVEQAARVYFDHSAARLTLAEAALLAGIPADPTRYDPVTNPRNARARRRVVLEDMLGQHEIAYNDFRLANRTPLPHPEDVHLPGTGGLAPYFTNYVKQLLIDKYGTGRVFGGGLRVQTSLDLGLQQIAREAISKWLPSSTGPAAALVAIDPRDGRVLAMFGGRNFRESQFNLAVQGERQPGSAFKPFALAAALSEGIAPYTTFVSKPVTISLGDKLWAVHNYEGSNLGPIDLETATVASDNTVYAQLAELVGPKAIAHMARRLGVTSPLRGYFSIVLGGEAVNPLEMARAYSSFANNGNRADGSIFGDHPRAIVKVNSNENAVVTKPALGENGAAIVTRLLEEVVTSGTGRRAALPDGRPVAGKTGTNENYGDAWFVGYTPQLAVAVWVGYPNGLRPMLTEFHGRPVAGGTFPALIFSSFMDKAVTYLKQEPEPFTAPQFNYASPIRVVQRDGVWQRDNGYCRHTIPIDYFSGYGPKRTAACKPNEVDVPGVIGQTLAAATARLALQPLGSKVLYRPARPGERLDLVVAQMPARGGHLSSHDVVTLVLAKPLHGVVPNVVGLPLKQARLRLDRRGLEIVVAKRTLAHRTAGLVVSQRPSAGVASAPGMRVRLALASTPAGG
jgi:penicillin-binding protein 1A